MDYPFPSFVMTEIPGERFKARGFPVLKCGRWSWAFSRCTALPAIRRPKGRGESSNRAMKKELLANTRIANLAEPQRQFGAYREFYNKGRPHHALNLDTPILKYTPSERLYPEKIS